MTQAAPVNADFSAGTGQWNQLGDRIAGDWLVPVYGFFQQHPTLLPLLLLLLLCVVRATGWHAPLLPFLKAGRESLAQSGNLAAAFPTAWTQRRLRQLMDDTPATQRAMQATEGLLGRWFGTVIWGPQAFERAFQIGIVYPLLFLLAVWVLTGQAMLGSVRVLPSDVPPLFRWLGTAVVGLTSFAWWQCWNWTRRRPKGLLRDFAELGMLVAAIAGTVAFFAAGGGADPITTAIFFVAFSFSSGVANGSWSTPFFATVPVGLAAAVAVAGIETGPVLALNIYYPLAIGVAVVVAVVVAVTVEWISRSFRRWPLAALAWMCFAWIAYATAAAAVASKYSHRPGDLAAAGHPFVLLVFLGLLPWWNAVLDVV